MLNFHKSLKGMSAAKTNEERVNLRELFESLNADLNTTLKEETIKKIKGLSVSAWEIIVGNLRVFYVYDTPGITVVHISRKQKNKTEKPDLKIVEKRAKEILNKKGK